MNKSSQEQSIKYYNTEASKYELIRSRDVEMEHNFAVGCLGGINSFYKWKTILDVGSGTGFVLRQMMSLMPDSTFRGIEPSEGMRREGYKQGIPEMVLTAGDAHDLEFEDNTFDCVTAFGVMHHLHHPKKALSEMIRVSKHAVFVSDMNNFGCGSLIQRCFSHALGGLGLWKLFQFLRNGGKLSKFSVGDGVHYSYSLFEDLDVFKKHGMDVRIISTRPTSRNLFWSCSHVAVLGTKKDK